MSKEFGNEGLKILRKSMKKSIDCFGTGALVMSSMCLIAGVSQGQKEDSLSSASDSNDFIGFDPGFATIIGASVGVGCKILASMI